MMIIAHEPKLNRRDFLRYGAVAAGLLAFPAVATAAASGKHGPGSPNSRIQLGFIGLGRRSLGNEANGFNGLVRMFLGIDQCRVTAVCDVNRKSVEVAAKFVDATYGTKDCLKHADFRAVLADPAIDAVVIATPHHWHGPMTVLACEHGKDVYVEKPTSNTIAEARAMVQAARRYGRVVQVGTQARSSSRFAYAIDTIRRGRIGAIQQIMIGCDKPPVHCDLPAQPTPDDIDWDLWVGPAQWRPYNEKLYASSGLFIGFGGGEITDWGQHFFDVAQWALGMDHSGPVAVYPPDGKEREFLTFEYANAIKMILHMKDGKRLSTGTKFIGTEGAIDTVAWDDTVAFEPRHLAHQYFDHTFKGTNLGKLASNHGTNFLDCVRSRKRPNTDIEIACRSVSVAHLANIGLGLMRPLRWNPATETFVNDDEANRFLRCAHRPPWNV